MELIEELCVSLSFIDSFIYSRSGVIRVYVRGRADLVRKASIIIREIQARYKLKRDFSKSGRNLLSVEKLAAEAGIAISPTFISGVLNYMGYDSELVGNYLKTDADENLVYEISRTIGSVYESLRFETKSSSVKRLVAFAAAVLSLPSWNVVDAAIELKLIGRRDDGLLQPLKDWKSSLNTLIDYLGK